MRRQVNRARPYRFVLEYDWLRPPGIAIELAINHCQSFWRRVVESFVESTVSVPNSSHKCHPARSPPHINRHQKKLAVCSRPAAGEMDEPSEQMRPLLRAVSTRPTQLTVGPAFYLPGSLSVFAPCSPRQPREYGDAWESDSVRHHPDPAIVSRLLLLTRGTGTSCVHMSR